MTKSITQKTPSTTPAALRARARRLAKAQAANAAAISADEAALTARDTAPNPFTAMAASLSTEEAEAAEDAAVAALGKARASSKGAPAVRPADVTRYTVGAYKGRTGAMYEFMKRAGRLLETHPAGYVREVMVASCLNAAPHPAVSTRAQALDYFAWAVRHGLLVEDTSPVVTSAPASAVKAPRRGARKGGKAHPLSVLLTGAFTA